jgi:hypothetical protein
LVAFLSCLAVLGVAAAVAQASQPVLVDFTAHGQASFNAQMSPAPCNGAAVYATVTDVISFSWETQFHARIDSDGTIVDEPGYLLSHDFGPQSDDVVGSGGDGSAGCNMANAMAIQSCPTEVQADITSDTPPELSDPDRAAHQPSPPGYENVDIQGPLHLGGDNPAAAPSIGCVLGFNDVSMLNASLPDMFTAHIKLPADIFVDPNTGADRDTWSTDVDMPATSPIDGSTCAAGNNGVAYTYCSKSVDWSGTITISKRTEDCSDGALQIANPPCPASTPVLPSATPVPPSTTVDGISGPSGKAATTGGALAGGGIPVFVSVSGPGTVTGSLTAPGTGSGGHAQDAKAKRLVIATGSVIARKAGRVKLRLKLTKAGRKLLRSWKRPTLSTALLITITSAGGHQATKTRTLKLRRTAGKRKH